LVSNKTLKTGLSLTFKKEVDMELNEIKNEIHNTVIELLPQNLKIALDFLQDLQRTYDEEAQALLSEPAFIEDYRQAKEHIRTGNTVSWKHIKRNV
jgi:hypothetical protein